MTTGARSQEHQQSSCSGLLVQRPDGATCVGLRSAFRDAVDLAAWHAAERPNVPPGDLLMAACLGRSVYESKKGGDGDAPPLCIGVEWLRYHHREMVRQQQQAAAGAAAFADDEAAAGARAGGAVAHAFSSERGAPQRGASAAVAAPAAAAPAGGEHGWLEAAAAAAQRRGVAALEEVFGDRDPLWFAKRFAERARTNADAMQRTALQLAAAALGHLPPEGDADE